MERRRAKFLQNRKKMSNIRRKFELGFIFLAFIAFCFFVYLTTQLEFEVNKSASLRMKSREEFDLLEKELIMSERVVEPLIQKNEQKSPNLLQVLDKSNEKCNLFGNSFKEKFELCSPSDHKIEDRMTCFFSVGVKTSYCEAINLIVDVSKVKVSKGGEPVDAVAGRNEKDEFPSYRSSAFQFAFCELNSENIKEIKLREHLIEMLSKLSESPKPSTALTHGKCEVKLTLIITRYEYANLYHTYTDWYVAYLIALIATNGDENAVRKVHIVFFDGHSSGALDLGWKILFPEATISYISEYKKGSNLICFKRALFVPTGYRSPISISILQKVRMDFKACKNDAYLTAFRSTMIGNSFEYLKRSGSEVKLPGSRQDGRLRVVFISRQNYLAHPRMTGKVTRRIKNEDELMRYLESYVSYPQSLGGNLQEVSVKKIVLDEYNFAEQTVIIQEADILIGMHGAGLTHVIVAKSGTILIEIAPPTHSNYMHFAYLCDLVGCKYTRHKLGGKRPKNKFDAFEVPIEPFKQTFLSGAQMFTKQFEGLD